MRRITRVTLAVIVILTAVSGCGKDAVPDPQGGNAATPFPIPQFSFRDVPGVTAQEIAAIEVLQQERSAFIYGMTLNTETFLIKSGESVADNVVGGYSALLCQWLTGLFGIPFEPVIFDWNDLLLGLENGKIDFSGDLTITDERRQNHFMTGTIAERSLKEYKIEGAPPIADIAKSRTPFLVFTHGSPLFDDVRKVADYAFEPVFVNNHDEAYRAIKSGRADAYLSMNIAELALDIYEDVVSNTFYPLVFASAGLSTQNPDLVPVLSVVQKALNNGGTSYLAGLYNQGRHDYIMNKFLKGLTSDELEYIQRNPVVKVATESDSYPLSFYNRNDDELQGIAFDVMSELHLITGLSFDIVSPMNARFLELTDMVENGDASMITAMMRSREREKRFLLPETTVMQEFPILVSKSEFPNVQFNELSNVTVGIVKGTLHAELFKRWFPNNRAFKEYDNLDGAFNALVHGEVDMFMAMSNYLLSLINYKELAGYKANVEFDNNFDITFGFNKDEAILYSIIDKALQLTDLEAISRYWMRKTYDYRAKIAEARLPWLVGATSFFLITLALILILFFRNRNLRKQKETEAKMREADERAHLLFDIAPFAGCMFDKDFHMIDCNQALVRMFGIPNKEFFLKRHTELFPEHQPDGSLSSEVSANNVRIALEKGYHNFECMHRKFSGEPLPVKSTLVCVKYRGEDVIASYFADLTEQKAMVQLARQQAEAEAASRAKSSFLATMSHEMRTPMNAIIGMTAIGKNSGDIERKDYALGKIEDAAAHLLSVINDVLDISKIEANKLELAPVEFNIERMLQRIVSIINFRMDERHQRLTLNVDKNLPRFVIGDDHRLSQVIMNLLSNAVKFSPEKGEIGLDVTLAGEKDGICEIRIAVSDNGIGISPEQQAKLFSAFQQADSGITRKFGGTGLGLSISKHIVELMGGKIWIESEQGKGSSFIFTMKAERGKKNIISMLAPGIKRENMRVLVVDDDNETCAYFKDLFGQLGLNCRTSADGFEAYKTIEEQGSYDIYFIDWRMPGMDGIELTRKIKAHDKDRPSVVVMISSADWAVIKDTALDAGVSKYILKPLFSSAIIDCINECLGLDAAGDEGAEPDAYGRFAGKKLLLAEDVEINREILLSLLEDTGVSIDCAENGAEAVEMVSAALDKYDAILMDVQMPKMDGLEATRVIRTLTANRSKHLPIIAMTAHVFKSDIEECLKAGMDDHIGKPIDIDDVMKKLNRHLNKK